MKTKTWLFSLLSCIAVSSVSAQNIPSHDAYVKLYDDDVSQTFGSILGLGNPDRHCRRMRISLFPVCR